MTIVKSIKFHTKLIIIDEKNKFRTYVTNIYLNFCVEKKKSRSNYYSCGMKQKFLTQNKTIEL